VNPLDLWALFRVGLIAVIGFFLLYRLVLHQTDWIKSFSYGLPGLLTAYSVASLLSVIWSVYPFWTLYKSTEYLVDIALMGAIVTSVHNARELKSLFDWTWVLQFLLIGSAWMGFIIWPDLSLNGVGVLGFSLRGVFPAFETNGIGEMSAILGSVAFTRLLLLKDQKLFYLIFLVICLITLLCSQSRSPLMGFLLALPVILLSSRRVGFLSFLTISILVILSMTSFLDISGEFFLRGQREADFESLSGRTNLWALGWEMFKERPFLGYGAYAGARFTGIADTMGEGNSSILNTWLEIVLGVGLLGSFLLLGAFCGVWIILFKRAWLNQNDTITHCLAVEALGALSIISLRSMFTVHLIWHPPVIFLLVLGYAELIRRELKKGAHENTSSSQLLSPSGR
jgi:O-antigen ligase